MGVRDRLRDLLAGSGQQQPDRPSASDLRQRLQRLRRAEPTQRSGRLHHGSVVPIEDLVDGREVQTPHGPAFVLAQRYDKTHQHGRLRLDCLDGIDGDVLAVLGGDERLAETEMSSAVFIDTETTGLAGGTGTYAFLVGIGYFEKDAFVVRLVFMRDLHEERACLHVVEEALSRATALVTFNGKSFDVPLLATRFTMNGRHPNLQTLPHLDLLHPAKRLYRNCFVDCRLSTLENEVLGLRREGDVASAEVPDLYREYLQTKDGRTISGVLDHNLLDILSLVSLTAHLARVVAGDEEALSDPDLLLRSARLLSSRGRSEQACRRFELALEKYGSTHDRVAQEARWELAMASKRNEDFEVAAEYLWALVELQPAYPRNYEELAKLHEHRFHDLDMAVQIVEEAIVYLEAGEWFEHRNEWMASFEHRLARLRRKAEKGDPGGNQGGRAVP